MGRASGLGDMFEGDDAALGRLQDPTSASYLSQDPLYNIPTYSITHRIVIAIDALF